MLIVLDTNVFCAEADPEESSGLRTLLGLAAETGTAVTIPVPCLLEAHEKYREKLFKAIERVKKAREEAIRVANLEIDKDTEVSAYEGRLEKFLENHGIRKIPFPDFPDPRTLFELAARKQNPFDPTGNNYRDAVIYLSVSQFARSVKDQVLFVTSDKRFQSVVSADQRVKPVVFQEAITELKAKLSKEDSERRTNRGNRIAVALRERFDELAKFVASEAEFSIAEQMELSTKLISIDKFEPREIARVEPADVSCKKTTFTAELDGQLHCTIRTPWTVTTTLPVTPKRVGQSVPVPESQGVIGFPDVVSLGALTTSPGMRWLTVDESLKKASYAAGLILQGDATFDEQGNVHKIALTRVREKVAYDKCEDGDEVEEDLRAAPFVPKA
jgi:PIN domain-containing protein